MTHKGSKRSQQTEAENGGSKRRQRTEVSRKEGRKQRDGRKEGAKKGRISDIKVSIVASLLSPFFSSFSLQGIIALQIVVNVCFLCEIIYRFVRITISKMTFLLFDMMDARYSDGSRTEKDNAIVKI